MPVDRFGEKLIRLRRSRGWSLSDLAGRLGYASRSYLSEVESGKKQPSLELVLGASRIFRVPTDTLLKDDIDLSPEEIEAPG